MEESIFIISVRIGLQMKFEFEGVLLSFDSNSNKFTFGESDGHYAPIKDGDMVVLDFEKRVVAFNSHHFSIAADMVTQKKVGDNYHFKCATDLCRVDVYVCDKTLWMEKKEAIFC